MRPTFHHDLAAARIADLHQRAARERMAGGTPGRR
jgi:hypothetical protein